MAYAIVQTKDGFNNSATTVSTGNFTTNPTTGNLIYVVAQGFTAATAFNTPTDTLGNTYVALGNATESGTGTFLYHWSAKNITGGGANSVTVTSTGTATVLGIAAAEISGLDTVSPFDVQAIQGAQVGSSGANAMTSGSATNTVQPALIIGFQADLQGAAEAAGNSPIAFTGISGIWNNIGGSGVANAMFEHARLTTTGSVAATFQDTGFDRYLAAMAVFKEAATGPTITTQPQDTRQPEGGSATFTVAATGSGGISYQWKLNGTNVGTNSTTYTRTGLVLADTGTVTVVATDGIGPTTSNGASLTVYPTGNLLGRHPLSGTSRRRASPGGLRASPGAGATVLLSELFPSSPSGALSGTIASTFTTAATLTGTGALAGTIAPTFGVTGTLSTGGSIGALSGTVAANFATSATLTGTGALSGTIAPTFATSATLTGTGALSGTVNGVFATSGTLTGNGALAGTIAAAFGTSATLTGTGALSGTVAPTFAVTGTLSSAGSGALSGTIASSFTASATLTGTGALTGTVPATFATTASLTGTGALSGTIASTFAASGTLTSAGSGALNGTVSAAFGVSATLTGTGAFTGTVPATFAVTGSLSGIRQISGTVASTFATTGTLVGIGALTGSVAATFSTTGTLTGRGALSGLAAMTFNVSGSVTDPQAVVTGVPEARLKARVIGQLVAAQDTRTAKAARNPRTLH